MRKKQKSPLGILLPAAAAVVLLLWFFTALAGLNRGAVEEGRGQLETAVRRAAAACYAAEGIYPPTLEYLTQHYGIQIGEEYMVFYDAFASNLMPDITVLIKGEL